jgi:hypothetical protein
MYNSVAAGGDEKVAENQEDDELSPEDLELGEFKIDGACPRCGRVYTSGHAKHLANCKGEQKPNKLSLAELVQLEVAKIEKQEQKLLELELGGLIDLTEEAAVFMVIGSKGQRCWH